MDFDDEAVGACGDAGFGHWFDETFFAGAVSGVDDDGEVAEFFYEWNGIDCESVARGVFEGADAAFAKDDVWVAVREDVFGGEKPFFDGGIHAAFEHDWFLDFADFF